MVDTLAAALEQFDQLGVTYTLRSKLDKKSNKSYSLTIKFQAQSAAIYPSWNATAKPMYAGYPTGAWNGPDKLHVSNTQKSVTLQGKDLPDLLRRTRQSYDRLQAEYADQVAQTTQEAQVKGIPTA